MLPLNYAILDYHSIKRCFHYNGSAGISFLLQQCIALDDFSEGHSDYWSFGRYLAFELSGRRHLRYVNMILLCLWFFIENRISSTLFLSCSVHDYDNIHCFMALLTHIFNYEQ